MSEDEFRFLSVRTLPLRLTAVEVGYLLGCGPEDVQALVKGHLIKPLGHPPKNGKKVFQTKDILALAENPSQLNRITNAIYARWREKMVRAPPTSNQCKINQLALKTQHSNTNLTIAKNAPPATIGFRLDPESASVITARANALGISPHELARHYVILVLHDANERQEISDSIQTLKTEIIELRKDVFISTQTLLSCAGKISAAEAKEWTGKNLKTN